MPRQEVYREYTDHRSVARAIVDMIVRGAPAIGVTAAFGLALAARGARRRTGGGLPGGFRGGLPDLGATRPTAVNLFWAIGRMRDAEASLPDDPEAAGARLEREALAILEEDVAANRAMGVHGAKMLPARAAVLTHCNAGALATAGYGTALGVVRAAVSAAKKIHVYVGETRPFLQGARLTAWELMKDGIPCTLITDGMAGSLLAAGKVDAAICPCFDMAVV